MSSEQLSSEDVGEIRSSIEELRTMVEELSTAVRETQIRMAGLREGVERQIEPFARVPAQMTDGLVSVGRSIVEVSNKIDQSLSSAVAQLSERMDARLARMSESFSELMRSSGSIDQLARIEDSVRELAAREAPAIDTDAVTSAIAPELAGLESRLSEHLRAFEDARSDEEVVTRLDDIGARLSDPAAADALAAAESRLAERIGVTERSIAERVSSIERAIANIEPGDPPSLDGLARADDLAVIAAGVDALSRRLDEQDARLEQQLQAVHDALPASPATDVTPVLDEARAGIAAEIERHVGQIASRLDEHETTLREIVSSSTSSSAPAPVDDGRVLAAVEELRSSVERIASRPSSSPAGAMLTELKGAVDAINAKVGALAAAPAPEPPASDAEAIASLGRAVTRVGQDVAALKKRLDDESSLKAPAPDFAAALSRIEQALVAQARALESLRRPPARVAPPAGQQPPRPVPPQGARPAPQPGARPPIPQGARPAPRSASAPAGARPAPQPAPVEQKRGLLGRFRKKKRSQQVAPATPAARAPQQQAPAPQAAQRPPQPSPAAATPSAPATKSPSEAQQTPSATAAPQPAAAPAKKTAAKKAPAKPTAAKPAGATKQAAKKTAAKKPAAKKPAAKKTVAQKPAAKKTTAKPAPKAVAKAPAKPVAKKPASKVVTKKPTAKPVVKPEAAEPQQVEPAQDETSAQQPEA